MHKIFIYFVFLSFFFVSYAQNITEYTLPPAPIFKCGDAPAKLNQIVYGATPPNSQNKPVVVFIHGWFDNGYSWFMAKNQWYQNLYNQNIRTAFLFQSYSGSFQDNGKIVADMIRKICTKYNTSNIIAVCHSKGGFDIEWAMYNFGIKDSVAHVITLNTPYYGAPIVDLISNPIIRLITENIPIVGPIFKGAGTYQMSPSYMKGVVRPMLDNHPDNEPKKFKCFGSWGFMHPTVLPNAIPDDILKVVFYDYNPVCVELPALSQIGSSLMSVFMAATGLITSIMPVQQAYQNPAKNTALNDGLAPYYSSIRPGAIEISERPNAPNSNLNHIDVLLSKYTWNIVNNEIQNIIQGNNNRIAKSTLTETSEENSLLHSMQLIDGEEFDFQIKNKHHTQLFLLGNYDDLELSIYNENNQKIQHESINHTVNNFWELLKPIAINSLKTGKYKIKTNKNIKAIVIDESDAKLELKFENNKIYLKTIDWNSVQEAIDIQATLNRNIDEEGNVIWDKIIPIQLKYNFADNRFESDELNGYETGNYNISVYAQNKSFSRFASTNVYLNNKENKIESTIKIFPNVATNHFTVEWKTITNAKYLAIYNIAGKLIKQIDISENANTIKLNAEDLHLPTGIYLIIIGDQTAKLVITK